MASSDFSDGNCGIVGVERVAERRQAYYGAGTAFFREAVEDGKILDSVFLRLAAFFDFDGVENAVFINDQVYFRPVTVAIVEETTANVESALQYSLTSSDMTYVSKNAPAAAEFSSARGLFQRLR